MIKRVFFIVFFVAINILCFAEPPQSKRMLSFETYSNANGLSHNNIHCIYQDSKGFLWIGTNSGLNRFDGKTFVVFKNDPRNSKTLSANNIFGICEDQNRNIWVATEYGLNQIIRESYECNRFFVDTTDEFKSDKNHIQNVLCDGEGNIWIKTQQKISRFNPKTRNINSYDLFSDIFQEEYDVYAYPIFQDSQGILWIGTDNGLGYYEPTNDDFIFFKSDKFLKNHISDDKILSIYEDTKHRLWIGTENGLNLFDKKTKKFYSYYYSNQFKSIVNGITEGNSPDHLWITTESNGVYCFNANIKKFTHFAHTTQKRDISTNQTNCITKSQGNILWIGTQNGLNKLDVKPHRFQLLGNEDDFYGVKYNHTTAICIDKNLVFFGTKFGGLQIYDLIHHTKKTFSADNGTFPTNYITSIIKFSENEILIGSDGYLMIYNTKTKAFYSIDEKFPELHSFCITNKRIKNLLLDSQGNLWIGSNFGIIFFNISKRITTHFDKKDDLPSNQINCFYENHKNKIFIGTENGLCCYDYKYQDFQQIPLHDFSSGKQKHIYDITEDFNGNIWIGTNIGLIKCNPINYKCIYYSTNEGLSSNEIYSVLTNGGDIWLGTDNGLNSFTPDSDICKSFSIHDGIQDYEFSPHAAFRAINGFMFFGGTQGINIFHPDSITISRNTPKLEFLQLEYTTSSQKHNIQIKNGQKIEIPWDNTNLNISFVALEYTQPLMNQYKYFITGQTEDWIDLKNQNYISIVKLPVGNYTLKIKAANEDGIWSTEKKINILVKPPFWRTTLAYIIEVLIALFLIALIVNHQIKKSIDEKKRLAEKQRWIDQYQIQKVELEYKNRNITDSITYAQRIQSAIMPAKAKFKQLVPNYFILYKPKDIVSGDFYWINKIDNLIFIVCADCTGHGVPGAFMSIIGNNQLRTITQNRKIHKASEILDYLNKALIELFIKNELDDESAVKDGMDISICVFHTDTCVLEFAGALTRMILVRDKQALIYRGNKFPVGLSNEQDSAFTTNIIRVQEGDRFYMFSDGYADQFGGENGKKMKFKQFKQNILSTQDVPLVKQGNVLKKLFETWQGTWEQVDDVIVMGLNFDNYLKQRDEKRQQTTNL